MRRNLFNEVILQPDDDILAIWTDYKGEPDGDIYARFVEEDDGKWGCELSDGFTEMSANDFESEEQLRSWLQEQKVEIDG